MAIRESAEIVIDAAPEAVISALADVEALPSWSPIHRKVEVIDRYDDGRPHHVEVTVRVLGIVDREVLDYHWGHDWVVWDASRSAQQHAQHGEYTVCPEGAGTRVRFTITMEPAAPIPEFLLRRARKTVLASATEGLRAFVLSSIDAQTDDSAGKFE